MAQIAENGEGFWGRETAKTPPKNKNTAHLARFHPSSTVGDTKPNSSIIYRIDYGAQGESPSSLKKQFKKKGKRARALTAHSSPIIVFAVCQLNRTMPVVV